MPELPEVETVRRGLAPRLVGRRIVAVDQRAPKLRRPLPARLDARLRGRRVTKLGRRAKYILVHLDDGAVLLIHLGMSGRMMMIDGAAPIPGRHDHVIFHFEGDLHVTFNDVRRFGLIELTSEAELDDHPLLAKLGIDPLDPACDGPALAALYAGRRTAIKAALLDQRLIAGIGNIYACEALYRAHLSPRRHAGTIAGRRAERLSRTIREVLTEALAAGGSSLRDYVQASGELSYFQHRFKVYDRAGEPCPDRACDGTVRRIVQGGRSTFHCPRCQR